MRWEKISHRGKIVNKYIITHERLKTQKEEQDFIVSALYNEKNEMIEVDLSSETEESILGNIYIGRVENVVKNLNAAFIKITPTQTCYYSLDDFKKPLFTKKLSNKKQLVQGEELVVQVSREAIKTKEPAVTTNITFSGKNVILTTENTRIGVSNKLGKEERNRFLSLLENFEHEDYGIIVRTSASEATDEEIMSEIRALEAKWRKIAETACHKACYTCLEQNDATYLKELKQRSLHQLEKIITDDRMIFEKIVKSFGISEDAFFTKGSVSVPVNEFMLPNETKICFYNDSQLKLTALYSVKTFLDKAMREQVWLKSGASIVIQPTEALTVIDVNSGKNIVKKDIQENFLKINIEAAKEIAAQLRLRNLSGIIIVDFINLKSKEAEAELLKEFRFALKQDPVKTDIVDMTKLGLVEVTRKKVKKSLVDVFKS